MRATSFTVLLQRRVHYGHGQTRVSQRCYTVCLSQPAPPLLSKLGITRSSADLGNAIHERRPAGTVRLLLGLSSFVDDGRLFARDRALRNDRLERNLAVSKRIQLVSGR